MVVGRCATLGAIGRLPTKFVMTVKLSRRRLIGGLLAAPVLSLPLPLSAAVFPPLPYKDPSDAFNRALRAAFAQTKEVYAARVLNAELLPSA